MIRCGPWCDVASSYWHCSSSSRTRLAVSMVNLFISPGCFISKGVAILESRGHLWSSSYFHQTFSAARFTTSAFSSGMNLGYRPLFVGCVACWASNTCLTPPLAEAMAVDGSKRTQMIRVSVALHWLLFRYNADQEVLVHCEQCSIYSINIANSNNWSGSRMLPEHPVSYVA